MLHMTDAMIKPFETIIKEEKKNTNPNYVQAINVFLKSMRLECAIKKQEDEYVFVNIQ